MHVVFVDEDGKTPLFEAPIWDDNVEANTKLVELGANVESKDDLDKTPLFDAAI